MRLCQTYGTKYTGNGSLSRVGQTSLVVEGQNYRAELCQKMYTVISFHAALLEEQSIFSNRSLLQAPGEAERLSEWLMSSQFHSHYQVY